MRRGCVGTGEISWSEELRGFAEEKLGELEAREALENVVRELCEGA